MIGTRKEQIKVIQYKMAKLGFSPEQTMEMDLDLVEAFVHLQKADERQHWETWGKIFKQLFGGK